MSSEVKVKVSLLGGGIETGLAKIKQQFGKLRQDLSHELGSFLALGGIIHGLESIIEKASKIANISKRFQAPPKELQRFANAARDVAELEDVARVMNKLAVNQQKAIAGNDEMRKSFEKLGIPMSEVVNMSLDQLLYRVADATATAEDRGKAYAAVVALGGRNAGILYSTLEKGSAVIKQQGDDMGVMADKTLEALHKVHVNMEKLKQTLFIYGGGIIMFFSKVVESIGALIGETANEIELLFNLFKQATVANGKFINGILHGKLDLDTRGVMNAIDDIKRNAGALKAVLKPIWADEEHHEEGKPKAVRDVDPSEGDTSKADKLIELRERLAEIQRKASNDELTIQQKINALVAQRAALLKEAAGTKDEQKKLELEVDAANVANEITAAIKERTRYIQQAKDEEDRQAEEDEKKAGQAPKIAANSLRRIGGQQTGGFAVGGGEDKLLREQVTHRRLLETIARNTASSTGGLTMK